jgi:hypothetical protein
MPEITLPKTQKNNPKPVQSGSNSQINPSDDSSIIIPSQKPSINTSSDIADSQDFVNPFPGSPSSNTGMGSTGNPMDSGLGGDPWSDPWGSWGGESTNGGLGNQFGGNPQSQAKKLTPQERVKMIEEVYQSTLERKPDTRDINYYKYSTLGEEEIRKQLIEGKEHKQLIEDGREYKNMKNRADQSETRVKMLEGQIKDQVEEFKQLTTLLNEKNRYIQQLRVSQGNVFQNKSIANSNSYSYTPSVQPQVEVVQPQQVELPDQSVPIEAVPEIQYTEQEAPEVEIIPPTNHQSNAHFQTVHNSNTQMPVGVEQYNPNSNTPVFTNVVPDQPTSENSNSSGSIMDKIRSIFSV